MRAPPVVGLCRAGNARRIVPRDPLRTCIACRARAPQNELVRLVRRGDVVVDGTAPRLGVGAPTCTPAASNSRRGARRSGARSAPARRSACEPGRRGRPVGPAWGPIHRRDALRWKLGPRRDMMVSGLRMRGHIVPRPLGRQPEGGPNAHDHSMSTQR
ncbi:DUF448 domain-containing protein [Tessaracoccus coleopterorum]|uniref:DUF448 domain-containing protein n=1 Tax=Tessaracoccus coleopterorum TaxID=2714950 RepID=UPI0038CD49A7